MIRNHYQVNHYFKFGLPKLSEFRKTNQEKFSLDIVKEQDSELPKPPAKLDYETVVTYSDGMKESLFDEDAYEEAMAAYLKEKEEYDAKINEQNTKTVEQQKQDAVNEMNEEWSLFNQRFSELQTELNTNGTNSKRMTFVMNELGAEYAELLQRKMEEKVKIVDNTENNTTIPNPPIKTDSVSEEEYELMLKRYNVEKLSFEKLQLEQELQRQVSELKISKIDSELEKIRKLLFGNVDLTQVYYEA